MAIRMAGSTAHPEGVQSILNVAEYIDSLVLSVDQRDASFQPCEILAVAPFASTSNRNPTLCKCSEQELMCVVGAKT